MRKLALLFGTTSYAVSTVLSIFFLGLGIGSVWGGRWADQSRQPLRLYGILEILIGLWALMFMALLNVGEQALVALVSTFSTAHALGILLRGVIAALLIAPPASLMGATLALLIKATAVNPVSRGRRSGTLYAVNTIGAVVGSMSAGFYLIPTWGYGYTTWIGAGINLGIGCMAILLARSSWALYLISADEPTRSTVTEVEPELDGVAAKSYEWAWIAFALTGFCGLAFEVLWTRILVLVFLGTTYAFTTMLTAILCGIAIGGLAGAVLADRVKRPVGWMSVLLALTGAAALWTLPSFAHLPGRYLAMQRDAGFKWASIEQSKWLISFTILFLPTFFSGMVFPFAVKAATGVRARLGQDLGRLYAANTWGGVLGALAGGFVLIPMLGTHCSIVALGLGLGFVGLLMVLWTPDTRLITRLVLGALIAAGFSGVWHYVPADISSTLNQSYLPDDHKIIHYREGIEGTVVVSEPKSGASAVSSDRVLWINGVQATAAIEKGVKMNRFQGTLPLAFNRDPKTVLFMCFGSGVTAGTLGLYPFERIDAVEISRDVLDAAPLFAQENLDVLHKPQMRFIVNDGRNFLLTTRNRYDVITFEPMPLAIAGVSTFYTQEYYRLCLNHLTPGGLVSQWVPLHSLDPDVVRSLIDTFTTVFPEYCAWFINADMFMIGSNQPLRIDYTALSQRMGEPALYEALKGVDLSDPYELMSGFFMGKQQIDQYRHGKPVTLMTDDRPWAEYVAPKLMYLHTVDKTLAELAPFMESPSPYLTLPGSNQSMSILSRVEQRFAAKRKCLEGVIQYYGGSIGSEPEKYFVEALTSDPNDCTARYYLKEITVARVKLFQKWSEPEKALTRLNEALRFMPDDVDLLKLKESFQP